MKNNCYAQSSLDSTEVHSYFRAMQIAALPQHTYGGVRLLGISGSLRKGSRSKALLRTLQDLNVSGSVMHIHTLGDLPLYNEDADTDTPPYAVADLRAQIKSADGVVISTPEYNHGIPGVLKNALDWASRPAFNSCFKDKPVLLVSSGPGHLGGVRSQYQMRETLASMLARVVPTRELVVSDVEAFLADRMRNGDSRIRHLEAGMRALVREIAMQSRTEAGLRSLMQELATQEQTA